MRLIDARTGIEVMDRAECLELLGTTDIGRIAASAALVLQRLFPRGLVTGLVGTGNNGGDALVLLRSLAAWGRPVERVGFAEAVWKVHWYLAGAFLVRPWS